MEQQFHRNETSWNIRSRGMKVPREQMFHRTKVLGTFTPEERKFHRSKSPKERMFHGTKVPQERKFSLWTFRSREQKCRGTKRPDTICKILQLLAAVSANVAMYLWDSRICYNYTTLCKQLQDEITISSRSVKNSKQYQATQNTFVPLDSIVHLGQYKTAMTTHDIMAVWQAVQYVIHFDSVSTAIINWHSSSSQWMVQRRQLPSTQIPSTVDIYEIQWQWQCTMVKINKL